MKTPFLAPALFLTVSLCACLPPNASTASVGSARIPAARDQAASARQSAPSNPASSPALSSPEQTTIPGPLRSFLRMAGISQKIGPDEVLPLLARNVVVMGYPGFNDRADNPSEYLLLLRRYLGQARELRALAGQEGVIRIPSCAEAGPLLGILGYKLKGPCGPSTSLETSDADRAFLTIDSGFPLADLEETLRAGTSFQYLFPSTSVPVLFGSSEWMGEWAGKKAAKAESAKPGDEVVDALLRNPGMARLYWSLSRIDSETRESLNHSPGLPKLAAFSGVLDFYGSHISIRQGRVVVPGGAAAESTWKSLAGADPTSPGEFVPRLLAKDEGWLAVYFDALAGLGPEQQAYFTKPGQLQRFYEAFRGHNVSPGPTRHAFRPDPGLILLLTRLQQEPSGKPHVPGNVTVWKDILKSQRDSKIAQEWSKRLGRGGSPDELVEAMFALSREGSFHGALEMYLLFSEIDRARSSQLRLSPETVRLMATKFPRYGDQYVIFSEFNKLNNTSISRLISVAEALDRIPDRIVRADAMGTMQASAGLWQILARQEQIPEARLNESWQQVIGPFANVGSAVQLVDSTQASLAELFRAVSGKPEISQEELISALAGPRQTTPEGQQMRQELASKIRAVMDDQRLVSLDTLLVLDRGLARMADGEGKATADTLLPFAGELREFEMPRPLFTTRERTEWSSGLYNVRHTTSQMRTDLTKVITSGSPAALAAARGELAPFLRDTLVGLNYAYYEPPGAQMLHNNPLFVRSHDFSGQMTVKGDQAWHTPMLFGRGGTASGGAHLAGSLADLPYVLAQVEQDFIVPENGQSLIWEDLVPDLLTSAVLPRWWGVNAVELHAVTLYQRTGEELLTAAAVNTPLRQTVMDILSRRTVPQRNEQIESALRNGHVGEIVPQMMPAETFYLAAEFRRRYPGELPAELKEWGPAGKDLDALARQHPAEVSWARLSEDFGVPHPALEQSYARELLDVEPFPTFLGYSSRLLAECWDSSNLYWARLADEMGYSPVMLNRLVPQLTRRMVEKIAASHPEDWTAVLRAMQETGEEFRQSKSTSPGSPGTRTVTNPSTGMPVGLPSAISSGTRSDAVSE